MGSVRYVNLRHEDESLATARESISKPVDRGKHGYKGDTRIELRAILHQDGDSSAVEHENAHLAPMTAVNKFDDGRPGQPSLWLPAILHWASLMVFGILFAFIVAALEVLNYFSTKNNGLVEADAKDYYLWTYGPTAGNPSRRVIPGQDC